MRLRHLALLFCLFFCLLSSTKSQDQTSGFAITGSCGGFSRDGRLIETYSSGVYDLSLGTKLFSSSGYSQFSPDSQLFADSETGEIIDVNTGEVLFTTQGDSPFFSPDGNLIISGNDAVYETSTGNRLYTINDFAQLSPSSKYLAINRNGVFETSSGTMLIETDASVWDVRFSDDDKYVVINGESVYEMATQSLLFTLESTGYSFPPQVDFSPDSHYLAVEQIGVYSVLDGEKVFSTDGWTVNFSNNGQMLGIADDGIYEVGTWRKLFDVAGGLQGPYFSPNDELAFVYEWGIYRVATGELFEIATYPQISPDGQMIIVPRDGIYDANTWVRIYSLEGIGQAGPFYTFNLEQTLMTMTYNTYQDTLNEACMIYGISGNEWPYRSGLVYAEQTITAYSAPSGQEVGTIGNNLIVFSQTNDGEWLRISIGETSSSGLDLWVKASEVTPLSLPDGIPIVNS
jgi:hypothetical protein